ncbi:enoyl-CoA hydratase/isomerase family protein [Streptomyces laculatispora]|uniref:3-hydroxyisobutyryl-CoA hydrolase n=1 Tax=Streptomyces laculatispora TaxID=887464 RepID=A0ABY9HVR8_9ACTN|nr:enoyl-CoA hydratase/isomerase family protein [Streptomyces laculatispora]WLQ38658.1 enoyl-CoA hydratase/isomerase family protein [Streptomyces laculatispora]
MNHGDPVLLHTEGRIRHITLNRPRALNALNHSMVQRMTEALDAAEQADAIAAVLLTGAGERGLCAGGDIRAIRDDALAGGGTARDFWRDEYRLNARIARFPKPYVAIMDGIVMGGGVGVSAHGSIRIVTERSRIAMPETGIGFVPDVGGTYLLGRAPGELGTHLALTGEAVGAADALLCGLADHFVPSRELPGLIAALDVCTTPADVVATAERYAVAAPAGELAAQRDWIDSCYSAGTVEEIVERLADRGVPAAKEASVTILAKSPTSLKVTLEAVRRARHLDGLEAVLDQEFRVSSTAFTRPDMVEGVRAQIVDKDRDPQWHPAELAEVTEADVARFFAPLGDGELGLGPGAPAAR